MKANPHPQAPKERKTVAQAKTSAPADAAALGIAPQTTPSPEGAKEDSELPRGWRSVNLHDIGELSRGKSKHRPRNDPRLYGGPYPFIQTGDIRESGGIIRKHTQTYSELGLAQSRLWPVGTLCITIAANIGETGILSYPACFPDSVVGFRHDGDPVTVRFIELYFRIAKTDLERLAPATAQKNINVDILSKLPIPLPPLPEQRRIVAEIEKQFTRLEAGVAALSRVQANLKRYRAAVLKAACEGKLVPTEAELCKKSKTKRAQPSDSTSSLIPHPSSFETGEALLRRILAERRKNWQGRGKYKEPVAPEPMTGVELPEGWVWTGFEQLADGTKHAIKAGPFGSSLKKSFYTPSGFKIYGQEQVIKGDPYFGDYFISHELFEQLHSCEVKPGDILISLVGTTGKVLILPADCAPGIINPRLLKLSLTRSGVNPKFIRIVLESAPTKAFFKLAAHGGTMEILNLGILKTLPIALPPLAEQTRIVAEVERRLSVVEELEALVTANLQRAARLRQSILQKAFTGKLI